MSTIGTVPYGTSKYLVEITQPTLNKNMHCIINSYTFVQEAKPGKYIKIRYKSRLYPPIPGDKAINILIDTLNNNKEHLNPILTGEPNGSPT